MKLTKDRSSARGSIEDEVRKETVNWIDEDGSSLEARCEAMKKNLSLGQQQMKEEPSIGSTMPA